MANVKLKAGQVYEMGVLGGAPVVLDATDHVHDTMFVRNRLEVSSSIFISGSVEANGGLGEGRFIGDVIAFYSSDKRMKDNIENISDPINKIQQIRGVYFDWNEKAPSWTRGWQGQPEGKKHDVGVIAQEIQTVLPEAVLERPVESNYSGMLAVNYEKIVPLLIEGIKEQQNTIEELTKRIEKLENK